MILSAKTAHQCGCATLSADPRLIHSTDQLSGFLLAMARVLASYRQELEDGGVDPVLADELCARMEERLFGFLPTDDV